MRAPFRKPGTLESISVCGRCADNDRGERRVEYRTVYRTPDSILVYEDDYNHYWDAPGVEVTLSFCTHCEQWMTERDKEVAIWVCGECKDEWDEESEAEICCGEEE